MLVTQVARRSIPVWLILLAGSFTEAAFAQTLQYAPYGSWRGRAVARDGLFRVQRYHWGSGVTPTGATVLNTLIPVIPEIIGAATGRDADSRSTSRGGPEPWKGWEDYAQAQREANALLERTAALVGKPVPPSAVPEPSGFPRLDPAQYLPSNPWQNVEVGAEQ